MFCVSLRRMFCAEYFRANNTRLAICDTCMQKYIYTSSLSQNCELLYFAFKVTMEAVSAMPEHEKKDKKAFEENGLSAKLDQPPPELEGAETPVSAAEAKQEPQGEIMAMSKPPSRVVALLLSLLLVGTGSVNTLAAKWADEVKVDDVHFNHPFFQADVMFVGEMTCMVAYFVSLYVQRYQWRKRHLGVIAPATGYDAEAAEKRSQASTDSQIPTVPRFNYFLFALPALCDVVSTSIQYLGLSMTSAASYQMLRGAVIIFTGILAMIFLRARPQLYRWMGMIIVVIGLAIVGIADIVFHKDDDSQDINDILVGDVLIIVAQIIAAIQMVVEQKLLAGCDVPALFAVGLEGIFGFIILTIAMIPMYYIHVGSTFSKLEQYRLEDAIDAFHMMKKSGLLVGALCTTIVSIAFFNFAGISVTKFMSATTRMVLDSVRTIIIWIVSCLVPYFEGYFIPLQILGFVLLIFGMFIYNDILFMPFVRQMKLYGRIFPRWYEEARIEREKEAAAKRT